MDISHPLSQNAIRQLVTSLRQGEASVGAHQFGDGVVVSAIAGGWVCVSLMTDSSVLECAKRLMRTQFDESERYSEVQVAINRANKLCLIGPFVAESSNDESQLLASLRPMLRLLETLDDRQ